MYMCDVYILCVCVYIVIAYVHICMYISVYTYVYILRNCEKYNVKRRTEPWEGPQPPCLSPLPAFLFPTLCSPRTWTNWHITSLAGGALKDMSLKLSGWHPRQWSEKEPGKRIISNHSRHKISSGWKSLPEPNHKVACSLLLLVSRIHSGRCLVFRCSSVGFSWIKALSSIWRIKAISFWHPYLKMDPGFVFSGCGKIGHGTDCLERSCYTHRSPEAGGTMPCRATGEAPEQGGGSRGEHEPLL